MDEIGMYFRVKREGEWVNLDILEMEEAEVVQAMGNQSTRFLIGVICNLILWINTNVALVLED